MPLNSIAFNGRQKNSLSYSSIRKQGCFSVTSHQKNINISLMIMKTTTNTCKYQKFSRKVREESVEAIETISVSMEILSMIH